MLLVQRNEALIVEADATRDSYNTRFCFLRIGREYVVFEQLTQEASGVRCKSPMQLLLDPSCNKSRLLYFFESEES